jgi:hypothetical protein
MSAKVILTIQNGHFQGQQYIFDYSTSCIIGRAEDCHIVLSKDREYSTISRHHCLLEIDPPKISIRDLGSRHGTSVNGKLIGRREENREIETNRQFDLPAYELNDEDEIELSNTKILINIRPYTKAHRTFKIIEPDRVSLQPTIVEIDANKFNFWQFVVDFLQRADAGETDLQPLKNYTLLHKLGRSSHGEVYLARDRSVDELVVLKLMLSQFEPDRSASEIFLREAKHTQMLEHPNLVKFIDGCSVDGVSLFVLEYAPGGTLNNLMKHRGGRLSIAEAIEITWQILDGLHYAHTKKGMVHRDIKPSNIFINFTRDNQIVVKLSDFGLTKAFDEAGLSKNITDTGERCDSSLFLPRQQILNFKYVQPNVDIWSTAATLYYMLTGFYPRNFISDNSMLEVFSAPPVPISYRNAAIPKSLADLIDLALKDNPTLYFNNALAFKNALLGVVRSISPL